MLDLKIVGTEKGWIFANVKNAKEVIEIANSSLFGNDVIRNILNLINTFIMGTSTYDIIIWNGEKEYYLFEYVLDEYNIIISIYYFDKVFTPKLLCTKEMDSKNGIKIIKESMPFWTWSHNTYTELFKLVEEKDYMQKTGFAKPMDLIRKIGKYYK